MRNSCTPSINLNVNLINFPSPIQLSMNQKITKSSLHQPKTKNPNNQSLTIHKKQTSSYHQNFEDSFDEFHPTMSTESLCKVKKIYQKTIKNKAFGKSLDDFLNADVQNILKKNYKTTAIKQLNVKAQVQTNLSSRQNTSKSNHNSQHSSKVSSRNSTEHLVSKQPQQIECYNTFQEDEDFVKFELLKNSLNLNKKSDKVFGKDLFKKNKSKGASLNNQKSLPNNLCDSGSQTGFKPFVKSKQYKFLQQNKPFSNNVQRSKSKSRSKSKQKSSEKVKSQLLRKLPSAKNIKPGNLAQKNQKIKSPIRHNTSRSPIKQSQIYARRHKQSWRLNDKKQTKKSRSKSRQKSKNQKKFIRSNIQIQISNHHSFSPSPVTKRGNKSKSFQRSRSISNHKSLSKQKRSLSKSANSKNLHLNKTKSPKQKNTVKEFKLKPKSFTQNASRDMNKSRSLSKEKHKRSIANEQKATSKQRKANKKTIEKQKMTKQFSQQVLKSSEFSKNKFKKIAYAKPDARTSPDHSRSTNFYLPERKESTKPKQKQQKTVKDNKPAKMQKSLKNISKANEKCKIGPHSNKQSDIQAIYKAAVIIQRIYRGYRVRKQLNQDLREICSKVDVIRGKIEDKRSKYWINKENEKKDKADEEQRKMKQTTEKQRKSRMLRDKLKPNPTANQQFQSLLSSSNSIQQLTPGSPPAFKRQAFEKQSEQNHQLSNQISRSITIEQNSKSQLLYFEQMVNKDLEKNERFLKESEQLKEHIRSISSEHLRSYDPGLCKENGCVGGMSSDSGKGDQVVEYLSRNGERKSSQSERNCFSRNQEEQALQQPNKQVLSKLPNLININPQSFQFYEPYSPRHYILSPKNPSPSVLRMISPISLASSFHHNQIPFSLQSPQNILNGENINCQVSHRDQRDNHMKERYFGAVSGRKNNVQEQQQQQKNEQKFTEDKGNMQADVERKIQMLKKLYYEDKLLSPKTFQRKLNALKSQTQTQAQQKPQAQSQNSEVRNIKSEEILSIEKTLTGKKLKITELTEHFEQGIQSHNRQNVSRVLFVAESSEPENDHNNKESHEGRSINAINPIYKKKEQIQPQHLLLNQQLKRACEDQIEQQQQYQPIENSPTYPNVRRGFPTELIFIKNYIFQFFTFIKSHPSAQKQLLTNLLSVPYDNEHLLTCYRTHLAQIDSDYYENKIQGQFLAYPYWRNLIDYEPIVGTDVFQRFSQMLQDKREDSEEEEMYFCVTEEQERAFGQRFMNQRMSLKELQRIFLMMLMDAFNQAFEQERCACRELALLRHQKAGMSNEHTVIQALRKLQQIQQIQKSTPVYYQDPSLVPHQQPALESSQNYQFFVTHSIKQKKQQLIDTIFCSVLKRVLQNWGRSMCGLIIEPEEEDEMEITVEQIQVKNTERLCLALNKYVEEYERQLANVMGEHEVCAKLVLADRVLEALLEEVVGEMREAQRSD